MNRITDHNQEQ